MLEDSESEETLFGCCVRLEWLSLRRFALGLTQQQVAERAGIKQQQYQQFESGKRSMMESSFRITCGVLEALGLNFEDYYHGKYTRGNPTYRR